MNYIKYSIEDHISVTRMDSGQIEYSMVLILTNIQRHAAEILDNIDFKSRQFVIRELSLLADLHCKDIPEVEDYGKLLNLAWNLKKQMDAGISNNAIDNMYDRCLANGAFGAKLLGAGGGGFMLALTRDKDKLKESFSDRVCLDVRIAQEGAKVVYRD